MFVRDYIQTEFKGYPSITENVVKAVEQSGVKEGLCIISVPDMTTALCITSFWDKRGLDDLNDEIDRNFPARVHYKSQITPFDASGNVKAAVVGRSTTILINNGKLVLGSSQGIVLLEFDHSFKTQYMGMIDLTDNVRQYVAESGVKEGICHVSQLHSTAGLLLCDNSPDSMKNIMDDIERMVPTRADFKHRETASDAGGHVKTALTDSQISLSIHDGELQIGKNQAIVFADYDGPRPRTIYVGVVH